MHDQRDANSATSTLRAGRHAAHVYVDSDSLCREVARFAHEALLERKGVLLIARREHMKMIHERLTALGADVEGLRATGQMQCHDAHQTLEYLMEGDVPNRLVFDGLVCDSLAQLTARRFSRVAAFGELVDILCAQGNPEAARTLERWWDELLAQYDISLLCGYRADPLDPDDQHVVELTIRTHTRVSVEGEQRLGAAVSKALCDAFPHGDAQSLRAALSQSAGGPGLDQATAALSGLRRLMPQVADDVLQSARRHYDQQR